MNYKTQTKTGLKWEILCTTKTKPKNNNECSLKNLKRIIQGFQKHVI